jgi:lipopolysaccharide export system ATP-binding protein
VSLEVKSGEVVGLLGPNGAGKTTCFYMMVGLIPSDGGGIYLDGRNPTTCLSTAGRAGLAYLPQEASIFPSSRWPGSAGRPRAERAGQ